MMIPDRLIRILRSCASDRTARFPATEIFNEGWMLRLVLDAVQTLNIHSSPLAVAADGSWYSEALLASPFAPRLRPDPLGEGFTNADAVIGHFDFDPRTKAGLRLRPGATQFVVAEAKMFSNLSVRTTNAPDYDQAARNVACMAAAVAQSGQPLHAFHSLGFFVIAPPPDRRGPGYSNLEQNIKPDSIRRAVARRIAAYEEAGRPEAAALRGWERDWFLPLLLCLEQSGRLAVLTWDDCINIIAAADAATGEELRQFYKRCLVYTPAQNTGQPAT